MGVVGQKCITSGYHCSHVSNVGQWRVNGVTYLVHDIFKRVWAIYGKADEEEVRLRIRQWAETVILFLSRRIPECELDRFSGRWMCGHGNVILEDGRDVFLCPLAPTRLLNKNGIHIPLESVPQRS